MMKKNKEICVVFRMDDYSAVSDTELESRIINIFIEKKIGLTLGVVPHVCSGDDKDPAPQMLISLSKEKAALLREGISSGCIDIALHGYSHQANSTQISSEFAGLDYGTQLKKISDGKKYIENVTNFPLEIFIPPWNQYDGNTLHALEVTGFQVLSAGWNGVSAKDSKIGFLPGTCSLRNIRDAINDARRASDRKPVIVVLFHHYDFIESNDKRGFLSLEMFSDLLDQLLAKPNLKQLSISQAVKLIDDTSSNRFASLERWRYLETFLPPKLREKKPVLLYHEADIEKKVLYTIYFFYFQILVIFTGFLYYTIY